MNKIINYVLLLIVFTSCQNMIKDLDDFKKGKKIQLLYLDAVESEVNIESNGYVNNRKILKEFELKTSEKESLMKEISKKSNYEPLTRKCKFEPVYAIRIDGVIAAVFDVEFCPTIKYYEKNGATQFFQLIMDSTLKTKIEELTKQ